MRTVSEWKIIIVHFNFFSLQSICEHLNLALDRKNAYDANIIFKSMQHFSYQNCGKHWIILIFSKMRMSPKYFLTLNNAQFFLHNHPHHYKCCLGLMLVAAALQYLAWCPKKPRRHPNVTLLIGMIHSIYVFYTRISCKMHFPGDAGDRHYCQRHLHLSPHPWLCYQIHFYLERHLSA